MEEVEILQAVGDHNNVVTYKDLFANDDYYYIDDNNNVYSIIDRTNNIVKLTKPEESRVITQILMEPEYEQEHL